MSIDRSDAANAERFVTRVGAGIRYVTTWKKFLVWDGRRWALDVGGTRVLGLAASLSKLQLKEIGEAYGRAAAAQVEKVTDGEPLDKKAVRESGRDLTFAVLSRSLPRLEAVVRLASTDPRVAIEHTALDADPWLLNVKNGTVDLRTGTLREASPLDLITKLAPVSYDAEATCPTWDAFLESSFHDKELVAYLQRLTGYCLTGSIDEHVLIFHYGSGANGKSTYVNTILGLLGEYACKAARNLLFRSRSDRHPTELAALRGARFVACSEIEDGLSLDEALVKDLTGGDVISARRMHEDFWQYLPTHKFNAAGNYKPNVRGDDEGIWRRLRLVPWTCTIAVEDQRKDLREALEAERPGILNWALKGLAAYREDGLYEPEAVRTATREYREESDALGQFLTENLTFEAGVAMSRAQVRELYAAFCVETGSAPLGDRRLGARLRKEGASLTSVRVNGRVAKGWRGVRVASEREMLTRGKLRVVK